MPPVGAYCTLHVIENNMAVYLTWIAHFDDPSIAERVSKLLSRRYKEDGDRIFGWRLVEDMEPDEWVLADIEIQRHREYIVSCENSWIEYDGRARSIPSHKWPEDKVHRYVLEAGEYASRIREHAGRSDGPQPAKSLADFPAEKVAAVRRALEKLRAEGPGEPKRQAVFRAAGIRNADGGDILDLLMQEARGTRQEHGGNGSPNSGNTGNVEGTVPDW